MNETEAPATTFHGIPVNGGSAHLITYTTRGFGRAAEGVEWFTDIHEAADRYRYLTGPAADRYIKVRMEHVR